MRSARTLPEFDLHSHGMRVDDALSRLGRVISEARASRLGLFCVITGYGSSGGTSMIKNAVLKACRKYKAQNHIRGFMDGEFAGDALSKECLAFPDAFRIPPSYMRSPNPGIVFISI